MHMWYRIMVVLGIVTALFLPFGSGHAAVIDVQGPIAKDTVWTSADTIHLVSLVTVTATGHLTILPGSVIQSDPATGFHVQGQLTAIGGQDDRVLFTAAADTAGGAPVAGRWNGIRLDEGSVTVMRNCDLRYSDQAIYLYAASLELDSCVIENFLVKGIHLDGGSYASPITPTISDCIIRQTDDDLRGTARGIYAARRADVTVSHCQIVGCYNGLTFEAIGSVAPHYQVSDCEISSNARYGVLSTASG